MLAVGNGLEENDRRGRDYKGGGGVIFDVSSGWRRDKPRIAGNYVSSTQVARVGISEQVSSFNSLENEYLPMVIEVEGESGATFFATGKEGGYDVNLHKYSLEHEFDTDAQGNITMHKWRFRRGEELSTSSNQGAS